MVGNDVAVPASNGTTPAVPATAAVLTIADWARELDAAHTIAQRLVTTPFAPKHFQGKPADAAAAILTGHELGLTPMASLRSIFMISGTPGMYAKVMVAIAQSRGHQVWVAEQSAERVVVKGRRKGEAEVYETVWDMERVKREGLTSNPKYRSSPQHMMVARGQAEIARQVAADALHGVPYSVEELETLPPIQATATVTAERLLAPARAMTSALPQIDATLEQAGRDALAALDAHAEPVDIGDAPEAITAAQSRKLHTLLGKTGRGDRDVGLAYLTDKLRRPVESTKTLTRDEASAAIDDLEAQIAAADDINAEAQQPELTP